MKKKGTRKVRKNKRMTQRRKNRSYKRMRGGMFNFKSRGFLASKKPIPQNVKDDIDTYTSEGKLYSGHRINDIKDRYRIVINTKDTESKTIYGNYGEEIKKKMELFTINTEEPSLTTLPISGTSVETLIDRLIHLGFLPDVTEFEQLYKMFYGINNEGVMEPGKAEKNINHITPFKFNGFALAVFLVSKYNDQHYDIKSKSTELSSLLSTPNPDMPPSFGILKSYLFELGPTGQLFWKAIPYGTKVTENPVCPFRGRIRYIKYGDSESPVTNKNINWLNYEMKACVPADSSPLLSSYFTDMNRSAEQGRAIKPGETTSVTYKLHVAPDTLPPDGDKFSEPKYKMYVSRIEIKYIDMTDFEKKSKIVCPPMSSYIQVIVITIYEYDEDGMINKVLVTYKFFEITTSKPDCTRSITDRYGKIINLNELVYREVVTDMETKLRLRLRPSKTLEGMLENDTVTRIKITAKRGDTSTPKESPVWTLYMTHTPHTNWTARPASVIQNNAFNAVNDYIRTHEWNMSNPVKRFLIENDEADKISVVIEVNELTRENTLKRATYCGEEMSEYELFDTEANAQINAAAKLANYKWTTSSGPIGL